MKLTIDRDALADHVIVLGRAVEKTHVIEILRHALIEAVDGALRLTVTDLGLAVTATIACEVEAPGKTCVSFQLLSDFVRRLPAGARVTMEMKDDRVAVRSGRARCSLPTRDPGDFPSLEVEGQACTFALSASDLATLFGRTAYAMCDEQVRHYLCGVYLHVAPDDGALMLRAVATDGHRLARVQLAAPDGASAMPGIIVPATAVEQLAKALPKLDGDVIVTANDARASFEAGSYRFVTKLVDGTFPDYQRVMPVGNDKVATVDAEALSDCLKRVVLFASDRDRAARFSFSGEGLTIEVRSAEAGEGVEEVEVEWAGPEFEIGFNARYLGELLERLDAETVQIKLHDPGSPLIACAVPDNGALALLMPLRV